MDWLTAWEIPVGKTAKIVFDWLKADFKDFFRALGNGIEAMIEGFSDALQAVPAIALVGALVALTWAIQRRWQPCVVVLGCLLFIINQGYWPKTTETLALVTFVCAICMAIGVPVGVAAAHRPRLYATMQPVLDLMQTLPAPVYLIPFVILFGIGVVPALFASLWCPHRSASRTLVSRPRPRHCSRRQPPLGRPDNRCCGRSNCLLPFPRSWRA
jgi:glycine betaine/proline transport system permease protein